MYLGPEWCLAPHLVPKEKKLHCPGFLNSKEVASSPRFSSPAPSLWLPSGISECPWHGSEPGPRCTLVTPHKEGLSKPCGNFSPS
jgi:hypothetical protein